MKMKEFVDFINIELKECQPQEIKTLFDLESALFILNLKSLVDKYKTNESQVSKKLAEPFVQILANRWEAIQNSDAIEQYLPQSQANKMARRLAMHIASTLPQFDAAKVLMPTLIQSESTEGKNLLELMPHQFILSDDNRFAIEVYPCLDKARSKTKARNKAQASTLCHTSKGVAVNKKELSEKEKARIANHSKITKDYMDNLTTFTANELGEKKIELDKQLKSPEYQVNPGYEMEGMERLRTKLYADIKTREDLFNKLNQMPKELWVSFCEYIDANDFVKIMTKDKITLPEILSGKYKIDDILQDKEFLSANKEENRARLFCLFDFYEKVREKGPYLQNKGLFTFFAYPFVYPFAYKRTHKVTAAEQMEAEIISVEDIGSLVDKIKDSTSELYKHQGALHNSELGKFTEFMMKYLASLVEKPAEVAVTKASM